ncbi:prolyl oligopeptidase family serine peptidase [Deinococcus yavapaiensis]|uniref:prolyl oligopeptidase n=1 Tax=Deinococcus yavapaiensis KR-236 TaxID=694435 RepID=A0A318S542_9DEIO|nr:prolyl oligopeptidase family serine peptidase [Deinococcus yavapaiensis]PYE53604.1 prolyl oligopeptidase [Deinococcus yavapaiensis KR-236]
MTITRLPYPSAPRGDQVDDYHGTTIPDPYRPLENPNSAETKAWVEAQNRLTFAYLAGIPERDRLRERLTALWNYPRNGVPWRRGGKLFRFKNTGLQNQDVLFVSDERGERELLDPNGFSDDGTASLRNLSVSRDGRFLAYAVSQGGSDWQTWFVRDVQTGEDLPDKLELSKFSGAAWLPDASGFYYGRYPAPSEGEALTSANYGQQLYLHRLGTPQAQDELVYERPDDPERGFHASVTHDGRYLVLTTWKGTSPKSLLAVRPLESTGDFVELVSSFEAMYAFVGSDGSTFYVQTDAKAPLGKLVSIDVTRPERGWQDVIAESEHKLVSVDLAQGELLALYEADATHRLRRFTRRGAFVADVELPALGTVTTVNTEPDESEAFFGFASFLFPTTSYRLDLAAGEATALETPAMPFDASRYETRQEFVVSKDGTRVPMFLVHKKGLALDGSSPTLLYGYGGFGVSLTPSFAVTRLPWLEMGGVLAVANLRGGGEYGETWHEAGTVHGKQNVFDDFIACAEHLVISGVTRPDKLAIQGGSNGGLLVGACMTQRPDLFGACLPAVGVLDMLRFHKFTIGWAWVSDYGSSDDPEQFETLLKYSPVHNVVPGTCYPPTFVTTGDHDDRVVPAHSYKFTAALQAAQGCDAPILIRVETKAGHGQGKPTKLIIEETADVLAFLVRALQLEL